MATSFVTKCELVVSYLREIAACANAAEEGDQDPLNDDEREAQDAVDEAVLTYYVDMMQSMEDGRKPA